MFVAWPLLHANGSMVRIAWSVSLVAVVIALAACREPTEGGGAVAPAPARASARATQTTGGSSSPRVTARGTAVEMSTPAAVVAEIGRRMKNVALLAPSAAKMIDAEYAGLVEPALLAEWERAPRAAPGRALSSPWPDRIEVARSISSPDGSVRVTGAIVEVTSAGEAARIPVACIVVRDRGRWRIREYREENNQLSQERPAPSRLSEDQQAAVATIRDYYAAIAAHEFTRAYQKWSGEGPPGQSAAEFAAGYANTESVAVETGTPSRVEPAAGSRYVEVPVVVTARTSGGRVQRFSGTYTLRRSVVDGASAAQRRWSIDRASLRETNVSR